MSLSTAEMQQVRRALGYGNLLASARPYFDIQLIFEDVVQQNLDTTWAEGYIRATILPEILNIEQQMITSRQKLGVLELTGDAKIDGEEEFRGLFKLMTSLMKSGMKKGNQRGLENLKRILESNGA